jgi:NAD(P)-dependent dehydrogenase (short-subunit alcohol dehydrogenase family)
MLARTEVRLAALEAEIPGTKGYVVDVVAVERAFARIRSDLGPVDVLVHNAAAGAFTAFMDTPPALLETTR